MSNPSINRTADAVFAGMDKNPELFAMTYGALVIQFLKDYQDIAVVNEEQFKMGYNMGIRMIDEFLARSETDRCKDFQQTCHVLAKIGMKMFMGVEATAVPGSKNNEILLQFSENCLYDFVELPPGCGDLCYANVICGAISGALRSIHLVVDCQYTKDMLRGSTYDEIRISLVEVMQDQYQDDEE